MIIDNVVHSVSCPLCKSESIFLKNLDNKFIANSLQTHFGVNLYSDESIINYEMRKCTMCTFEFANPQLEGSSVFYNWVTKQNNYYPKDRWEYHEVKKMIDISKQDSLEILDVGCGDGKFFDVISKSSRSLKISGLDLTEESVNLCRKKGYEVYNMTLDHFIDLYPDKKFDFVVSFHVLEHIANPLAFLEKLSSITKKNGSLILTTPYSPMTFEYDWYDCLNNPPHHLGRWNYKSYEFISKTLNLNPTYFFPKPNLFIKDAINSFLFSKIGNKNYNLKKRFLLFVTYFLKSPQAFVSHLLFQVRRDKINGKRVSDLILVKLTRIW